MHEPWNETEVWKNKSAFFTWLRGQIRKSIWQNYPLRNEFKDEQCVPITEEIREEHGLSKQTKKVAVCHYCSSYFPKSKLEVDHVEMAGSIRDFDEIGSFVAGITCSKTNMVLTCKPCHKVKSYAERMGISFDLARTTKKAIDIQKGDDKLWLSDRGITPETNAKKRRDQIIEYLSNHEGE